MEARSIELLPDEAAKLCQFIKTHKNQRILISEAPHLGMGYDLLVEAELGEKEDITTEDITNF